MINQNESHDPAALRAEFWLLPQEAFVDRATAGASIYLSIASMEALAIRGGGPPYTRISRRALYRKADLLAWAEKTGRRVENTAQLTAALGMVSISAPTHSDTSRCGSESAAAGLVNRRTDKASAEARKPEAVAKAKATRAAKKATATLTAA